MVVAELSAGYSALKTALEITKGLKDIHDQVKLNSAVIELQGQILEAQEAASVARDRMRELQDTIAAYEDWNATAKRYQLIDFGGSTFAYGLIADHANGEPIHRACPKCFENRKRSILQFDYKDSTRRDHYKCSGCGTEFVFGVAQRVERQTRSGSSWMA